MSIPRRTFLQGGALSSLLLTSSAGLFSWVFLRSAAAKEFYLRPPGALEEKRFIGACVKCGRCAQACPYKSI